MGPAGSQKLFPYKFPDCILESVTLVTVSPDYQNTMFHTCDNDPRPKNWLTMVKLWCLKYHGQTYNSD